jgi:hypothetical protein
MDGSQFDSLTQSLAQSRRSLLGGGLALAGGWPGVANANARKKRRKKKPKFNQFGCLDVGQKCDGNDARCCSGICEGTKKTSRCVAHNELDCDADDITCSESVLCGTGGVCYRTTGKAGFCGNFAVCNCGPCQKDVDCEVSFGPGAACVVCTGDCAGVNGSQGSACVPAA